MKLTSIIQIFWPFSGGFGTRPPGTVVERYDLIGTSTFFPNNRAPGVVL